MNVAKDMENDQIRERLGKQKERTPGEIVTVCRKKKGWTQEELAYRCSISVSQLSRIERNLSRPSFETMLYGHVHNTHDETLINRFIMETRVTLAKSKHADQPKPIPCNMINCFCMFSNYQPMTLDEWIEIDRTRREKLED